MTDRIEHGPADVLLEADQNLAVQAAAIALSARLEPRVQAVRDVLKCQCRHGSPLWNRNGSILTQRPPDDADGAPLGDRSRFAFRADISYNS